jgi:hypothetical protein
MDDRGNMEAVQFGQLALPVPGPRTTALQHRRLPLPLDGERPKLYVIVTPPEVRERWLRWVAIRQSVLLTFVITFALLIAAMAVI